jgi:hypothetical protein
MEEVDMDGSESDQELTGNETDESEWASKVHEHVWSKFIWSTKGQKVPLHVLDLLSVHNLRQCY